jgi:hypothetical protein
MGVPRKPFLLLLLSPFVVLGCSHAQAKPIASVQATPPPKDDGKPADSNNKMGNEEHAAAMEQLKVSPMVPLVDKQNSVLVQLPDGEHWMRVRFWGVTSLVGFRYGKEHHAIVGGFVTHVPDNKVQGACSKSFEEYAKPYIDNFDVNLTMQEPHAFPWQKEIVEVEVVHAKIATIVMHDEFSAAFASYPAWDNACLIIGVAVPARGDMERADAVRDRFVAEVFQKVQITSKTEPKERY